MEKYDKVIKEVEPKRQKLREAEGQLEVVMGALRAKQAELKVVMDKLARLDADLQVRICTPQRFRRVDEVRITP